MLSKDILIASQTNSTTDNIVKLWVGDGGVGDYGYCGSNRWDIVPHGTLDRIPFWYGSYDGYFALGLLNEIPFGKYPGTEFRTYYPDSGGTPSLGQEYTIKVTRCDNQKSITFSGEHGQLSTAFDDTSFNLFDSYRQHVTFKFDPPPTVIWIPTPSNRSRKRVLRRGSSLGGSRW